MFKNNQGIAHLAVLLVISAAAIGFVGWASWNAWQANKKDYSSNEMQADANTDMPDETMTDEHHIEALIKSEDNCGAGQEIEIAEILVYKGFARVEVGCAPQHTGGIAILKKIDDEWQRISGTQNCLDPILKSRYEMSDQVKKHLFPTIQYCGSY